MVMERRARAGAPRGIAAAHPAVRIETMRRRHLRGVLHIEQAVNPRPWSLGLFMSELRYRDSRVYVVARSGVDIVGFAGLMLVAGDGHITNVGVDSGHRRSKVATRMLLVLARRALAEDAVALTLEVRMSNTGAQALYRHFGFIPAGVRKDYYPPDAGSPVGTEPGARPPQLEPEDALIMWANDIDTTAYRARLLAIERSLPSPTVWEDQ